MKRTVMRRTAVLASLLPLLCLQGCFSGDASDANLKNSSKLRSGMTKAEVRQIMGSPLSDERFCKPDVWYYYIRQEWADGMISEDECLPLVFKDGKLLGWGHTFLAGHRMLTPKKDEPQQLQPAQK